MIRKYYLMLLISALAYPVIGLSIQSNQTLVRDFENNKLHDTTRLSAFFALAKNLVKSNPDTVLKMCQFIEKADLLKRNKFYNTKLYSTISRCYRVQNKMDLAVEFANKAIENARTYGDFITMAKGYVYLSGINSRIGKFALSIENLNKATLIFRQFNDEYNMAICYKDISANYHRLGLVQKTELKSVKLFRSAFNYSYTSAKLFKGRKDTIIFAHTLNLMGLICSDLGNLKLNGNLRNDYFQLAIRYYLESLKIFDLTHDVKLKVWPTGNIGWVYRQQGKYDSALILHFQVLEYFGGEASDLDKSVFYTEIGLNYVEKKDCLRGRNWLEKGLPLAEKLDNFVWAKMGYEGLVKLDSLEGNYKNALRNLRKVNFYKEKGFNDENNFIFLQMKYESDYNLKREKDVFLRKEENKIKDLKLLEVKRERTYLYIGLVLIVGFLFYIYNRFKVVARQKKEIEKQKLLVEEKQKEILDSIHYAKRIQMALLPKEKYMERNLKI